MSNEKNVILSLDLEESKGFGLKVKSFKRLKDSDEKDKLLDEEYIEKERKSVIVLLSDSCKEDEEDKSIIEKYSVYPKVVSETYENVSESLKIQLGITLNDYAKFVRFMKNDGVNYYFI